MASPAVTDRALRYRAQKNAPPGPKVCCYCGSTRNVEVDHVDGHEENFEPENLAWSCRSCNTAKANTMRAAGIGRLTRQYNPGSKGAHTVGEWMQAVGAITPHKGRKYAGYNYGLVSDMPVHEAVSIIRATPPARRAKFASQLRRHNPPDLNESVQDRSYREWAENFQHVSASPEDASERDLRRAIGYLDHARRWYIRRMQADRRPVDPNVLAGYDNEAEYFLRLSQRPEAKRRNPIVSDLKASGRGALKQYDRVTGTAGKVLGTVLDLPRKWAGAIVGEKANPRPAEVPRNYEVVSIRSQAQDAQDVKDALERTGIPAIIVTQRHTSIGTPIGSPYSVWTPKKTYRRAVKLAEQAYFARHPERLQPNPAGYDPQDLTREGRKAGDEFYRATGVQPRQVDAADVRKRFEIWWKQEGSQLTTMAKSQALVFWRIGFTGKKRNPDKFDRCVRDVQARGGPVNAYAVCTAAGTRNPAPPTLDELRATVTLAGYTPGVSYDDNQLIYAASQESTGPGTYGHPAFEAIYHKETGWLTVGDTHTFVPNPAKTGAKMVKVSGHMVREGSKKHQILLQQKRLADDLQRSEVRTNPYFEIRRKARGSSGEDHWLFDGHVMARDAKEAVRLARLSPHRKKSDVLRAQRVKHNPPNPHEQAAAMYESFHGKPPENEILVQEEFHVHEHLAPLGVLVNYKVATITGLNATIESSDAKTDYDEAAADPNSIFVATNEQGTQLYFVGGDQSLDLKRLEFPDELVKDDMIIGTLYELTYRTRKKFDKFKLTDYYHGLGEDTGEQPLLRYDPLSPHQYVSGGAYKIEQPLIGMSPGIEN